MTIIRSKNELPRTLLPLVVICILVSMASVSSAADQSGRDLADKMLAAYGAVKTYSATWEFEHADDANAGATERTEVTVAFDRASKRALLRIQSLRSEDGKWKPVPGGMLFVNDGKKLLRAIRSSPEGPWMMEEVDTPAQLSYRDWRRFQLFFYAMAPDQPLLFGEQPLEEWLQGEVEDLVLLPPAENDEKKLPGLRVTDSAGETSITVRLDPKSFLIQEAKFQEVKVALRLRVVAVDQPLNAETFDFEKQLTKLDPDR